MLSAAPSCSLLSLVRRHLNDCMGSGFISVTAAIVVENVARLSSVHLQALNGMLYVTPRRVELVAVRLHVQVVDAEDTEVGKALDHAVRVAVESPVLKDVRLERVRETEVTVLGTNEVPEDAGVERVADLVQEDLHLPVVVPDGGEATSGTGTGRSVAVARNSGGECEECAGAEAG